MYKQKILPILMVFLGLFNSSRAIEITGADLFILPEGETSTLSGTGLGDATAARMIWPETGAQFSTAVNSLNDTTLEITMPDVTQESRNYNLIVETSSGSTICIPDGYDEHTSVGEAVSGNLFTFGTVVVRTGAVLSGDNFYSMIIVETGGVVEVGNSFTLGTIIAEDGAVIDFTDAPDFLNASFLHSPETVIIGSVPSGFLGVSIEEELPSISVSYGLEAFQVGYPINFSIVGDGTIIKSPDQPYYSYNTDVELTAEVGSSSTFSGWSGAVSSALSTITVQPDRLSSVLTATFSTGWLLDVYEIPGVTISLSPDKAVYADGQSVTLTASLNAGYTFQGWGLDASGSGLSTTLTMDANKVVIPLIQKDGYEQLPQVTSSDLHVLPEGATMTLTGSGLADANSARMIWAASGAQFPAALNSLDDNSLEVTMPDVSQESRDYYLIVETGSGSTIGISSDFDEHTDIGAADSGGPFGISFNDTVVVRPGAVLSGDHFYSMVVVESGGVLEVADSFSSGTIVAEDGAVIDFTSVSSSLNLDLLHSPDTAILGEVPRGFSNVSTSEELTSIRVSFGLDSFTVGYAINLSVVGVGIVTKSPDLAYYRSGVDVQLEAIAGDSSTFSGWSGAVSSGSNIITVQPDDLSGELTATFSTGWLLDVYDIPGVTVTANPSRTSYANGESVVLTASLDTGYTFRAWGLDVSGLELTTTIMMDDNKLVMPVVQKDDYDQLPQVTSSDLYTLPEGEVITLTGNGLADVSSARMIWATAGAQFSAIINPIDDNALEVTMPDVSQENRDYHLLFETPSGSTICIPSDYDEHTGIGAAAEDFFGVSGNEAVVVRAGAVLSGDHFYSLVVVEAGGVLEIADTFFSGTIIAEGGAVIDFGNAPASLNMNLLYSPDTVIVGTIPTGSFGGSISEELTPIKASYGMDTFTVGYQLNIAIEGPGSVSVNPSKDYYTREDTIELTAVENEGAFFIRWVGEASGSDNVVNISISENTTQIARFSTAPDYFSSWRLEHFSIEELGNISISAFDADPDRDSVTNAAEYAFGTDPRAFNEGFGPQLDLQRMESGEIRFYASYTRPKDALDVNYRIMLSQDMAIWNHNDDGTDVIYSKEVSVEPIDDDNEKVTVLLYPNTEAPNSVFIQISAALFE